MAVFIEVKVIPRAARPGMAGTRDGVLLVRINAPPVEGAANAELVEVLSRRCGSQKEPSQSSQVNEIDSSACGSKA